MNLRAAQLIAPPASQFRMQDITRDEVFELFRTVGVFGYNSKVLKYLHQEVFCQQVYRFRSTTTNPLIIDCGSNIGMSILFFKSQFPNAAVIEFEANPFAFRLLCRNVTTNGLTNVTLHNVALYDRVVDVFLHLGNNNLATPLAAISTQRSESSAIKMRTVKLSTFIESLRQIDLIKIDVEGSENMILNDLEETGMLRKSRQYVVEFHGPTETGGSGLAEFLARFERSGFDWKIRASGNIKGLENETLIVFNRRGQTK